MILDYQYFILEAVREKSFQFVKFFYRIEDTDGKVIIWQYLANLTR